MLCSVFLYSLDGCYTCTNARLTTDRESKQHFTQIHSLRAQRLTAPHRPTLAQKHRHTGTHTAPAIYGAKLNRVKSNWLRSRQANPVGQSVPSVRSFVWFYFIFFAVCSVVVNVCLISDCVFGCCCSLWCFWAILLYCKMRYCILWLLFALIDSLFTILFEWFLWSNLMHRWLTLWRLTGLNVWAWIWLHTITTVWLWRGRCWGFSNIQVVFGFSASQYTHTLQ